MRLILRFLSSLKLGLVLIALLAVACIAGSLIAANENMGVDHGRAYVFHTPWFLGLMGLLLVNLCLCSWEKSYIALTLYKKKNPITVPRFYEKAGHAFIVPWRGSLDEAFAFLRKHYTTAFRRGNALYFQKGLVGRTGATIIHIGLLWTMAAGYYRILADDFGWGVFDSTVILPEGESTDIYYSRIDRLKKPEFDNLREKQMPFTLRCLDFTADYHPHSTVARRFSSLIEIRDGDYHRIGEVTMQEPMLYKGYKITQNSFSPNERIRRGQFRIVDTATGRSAEFDAGPGDPVKVPLPGADQLFFQTNALAPSAPYFVMDLTARRIVQSGELLGEVQAAGPLATDFGPMQSALSDSRYSFVVAALFPNFTFDEQKRPTTRDENFENPAVLVMLFKNGQPNGYAWLFHNPDAQQIVGQPHPEVEMRFTEYRTREGADGSKGLFDYEVRVTVTEKGTGRELGAYWAVPGTVNEVSGISPDILAAPNVMVEEPGHGAHSHDHSPHDHERPPHDARGAHGTDDAGQTDATDPATRGGAAESATPAGGIAAAAPGALANDAGTTGAAAPAAGRYQVYYLGTTSGHVTFLGFMKDPSVGWLFTGCIIIVLGTLIAFMITYREAWVWHDEENGLLYMATSVRGTSPRAHREFDRIATRLIALGEPQEAAETSEAAPVG